MSKERKPKHFLNKPQYEGGPNAMKQFIAEHIQYPEAALEAKVEGTVQLRYDINHRGVVTGAKIISGIGHGCDEEAIRLVKLLRFEIGKNRGIRAVFHKTIRIHFRLPQKREKSAPSTATSFQYSYTSKPETETDKKNENPDSSSYTYTIHIKPSRS